MSEIELECTNSCENYLNIDVQNSKRNSIKGKTLIGFGVGIPARNQIVCSNDRMLCNIPSCGYQAVNTMLWVLGIQCPP